MKRVDLTSASEVGLERSLGESLVGVASGVAVWQCGESKEGVYVHCVSVRGTAGYCVSETGLVRASAVGWRSGALPEVSWVNVAARSEVYVCGDCGGSALFALDTA